MESQPWEMYRHFDQLITGIYRCKSVPFRWFNEGDLMIPLYRKILLIIVILSGASLMHATHNRAGEITYEQIGELTNENNHLY